MGRTACKPLPLSLGDWMPGHARHDVELSRPSFLRTQESSVWHGGAVAGRLAGKMPALPGGVIP